MLLMPWYGWLYLALINLVAFRVVNGSFEDKEYIFGFFETLFYISVLAIIYTYWNRNVSDMFGHGFLFVTGYALAYALFEATYYSHLLLIEFRDQQQNLLDPRLKKLRDDENPEGVMTQIRDLSGYFLIIVPSMAMGIVISRTLIERMVIS